MTFQWKFTTMEDAFDYVRETDRPQMVIVGEKAYKLYPSGRVEQITRNDGKVTFTVLPK